MSSLFEILKTIVERMYQSLQNPSITLCIDSLVLAAMLVKFVGITSVLSGTMRHDCRSDNQVGLCLDISD